MYKCKRLQLQREAGAISSLPKRSTHTLLRFVQYYNLQTNKCTPAILNFPQVSGEGSIKKDP